VIQNNILYQNAATLGPGSCQGIDFVVSGGGHVIRHNLFYGTDRISLRKGSDNYTASGNREVDPLFVAPERFDFRLRKGSPAIDAGTPQDPVATDRESKPRPQGKGYDLGAYEYRGP
jgi:hypothetical protein